MSVEVLRFHDPAAFAAVATPFLMQREAENCFFLGLIPELEQQTDPLLLVARTVDGPVAVAIGTANRPMVVTDASPEAAVALADYCAESHIELPGMQSMTATAQAFAARWSQLSGGTYRPDVRMAIHVLTEVVPPSPSPGAMRLVTQQDKELLVQFVDAFRKEVRDSGAENARTLVEKRLPLGNLFLWQHGKPVALAGFTGPTPNGMRVVLVYTPPEQRGRGYASNLVAALSQHLLDSGRTFCFLYTDLANPTSNKIYRDIGYRQICEQARMVFEPAAQSGIKP
jgi:predicted GNAT family acetyltransferase